MTRFLGVLWLSLTICCTGAQAQEVTPSSVRDVDTVIASLPDLARQTIKVYQETDQAKYFNTLFRLQSVADAHSDAVATLDRLQRLRSASDPDNVPPLRAFQIAEQAFDVGDTDAAPSQAQVQHAFRSVFDPLSNADASRSLFWLQGDIDRMRDDLRMAAQKSVGKTRLPLSDAIDLIRKQHILSTFETISPFMGTIIAEDDARRYQIDDRVLVRTRDGADIAAITVRPRQMSEEAAERLPALLVFTIYADDAHALTEARTMAAHGYAGIVAYTRGKGRSPQTPVPYEHDGDDARAVIDWIARQPWSDGRVGMYGGSYDGFTQWAAAKALPAALKTIVPYAANNPGNGLPMENNLFIFANYAWPFYTTNNKSLDNQTYFDNARWNALNERWYISGQPYHAVDRIDGTPNSWLQRWLKHPGYDQYWQRMTPYRHEFAGIDIPVLTITGYFDDGQQSAIDYLRQHYRYRPNAEHYLLIGPYDHFGAQASRKAALLRGYQVDPVAMIDTQKITYQWMDHVFRGGDIPELLQDRINYEVMGANVWKHAPSIDAMSDGRLVLYLSATHSGTTYTLTDHPDTPADALTQEVDFSDRTTQLGDHYPDPVIGKTLDASSGLLFTSAPFETQVEISGLFSGAFHLTTDRRDLDFSITLYEQSPSGILFHLSYILGRASYANNMSSRALLTPGKKTAIHFDRTRMTSRRLQAGSRLVVAVTVNKNAYAQINYGTGKDVSAEDIRDAGTPMQVRWHTDSHISIPISR